MNVRPYLPVSRYYTLFLFLRGEERRARNARRQTRWANGRKVFAVARPRFSPFWPKQLRGAR